MIKSILIIDDEPQILRAFKRVFANKEYTVQYRESARDALDFLSRQTVDLVITDIRMPVMDGLDFIKIVKEKYPRIVRIVLSGYTDMKIVFKALEENLAKTYWVKPWDNDDFVHSIEKLSELEELFSKRELLEFFNNMSDLPTMPEMYLTISRLIREEADVEKVAKVIEKDPAIASRVLRIANSAFYGAQTGSIQQSIMFIGLANVKNIILSHSVFEKSTLQKGVFQNLWAHANRTNTLASLIYSDFLGRKIPQMYASAGLLHNIGLIVLWMRGGNAYLEALEKQKQDGGSVSDFERGLFSVSHEELGAYLLNWWDIPLPIVEAALYHHKPSAQTIINKEMVAVIHLAHYYAWESLQENYFKQPLDEEAFKILDINQEALETRLKDFDFSPAK